jgi:hypothetical protein
MKQASPSLQEPASSFAQYYTPYHDGVTKEKIQRHLTDINDVITDEDLRNVDTAITLKPSKVGARPGQKL